MKAIRVHEHGGPEVMQIEEVPLPQPGAGEALVKLAASGVNFIDIYQRTGRYPVPTPYTLGSEGAGVVESVGPGVVEVAVGDRVAYAMAPGATPNTPSCPQRSSSASPTHLTSRPRRPSCSRE